MTQLAYSREDILASHPYARRHEEAGYLLHGGFLSDGRYASPRTLLRGPAARAWAEALTDRGWPLIDCSRAILVADTYPNRAQQEVLLAEGLGQTLWDSLTRIGVIEARGGALCTLPVPDFQEIFVEPIAQMAVGHLHKGLLWAHGADEAGDPNNRDLGAHDKMWFACRDLVFGKNAYPRPDVPASISRPGASEREMAMLPAHFEALIKFMMNLLMIEVRAENFFDFCRDVFANPQNFRGARENADTARLIVERIRADETVHVAYLQASLSEMRSLTIKTLDGGTIAGAALIDPMWETIKAWPDARTRAETRAAARSAIERQARAARGEAGARALLARFDALASEPSAA